MIKTKIEFNCTWSKADVQKLFDKLITATGITELGMSMIFMPDETKPIKEPKQVEVHTPEPKHIETEPLELFDVPWPAKEEPQEQAEPDPDIFTEIERISGVDIGQRHNTSKPILTYAETNDGRVVIYYNESPMYTTLDTVRALPDKIPLSMVKHLSGGKRAALRGFKKWLTEQDTLEDETPVNTKSTTQHDSEVDPYAPILTGGAKVDTGASG